MEFPQTNNQTIYDSKLTFEFPSEITVCGISKRLFIIYAAMLMKALFIKIRHRDSLHVHQWKNRISYSQK